MIRRSFFALSIAVVVSGCVAPVVRPQRTRAESIETLAANADHYHQPGGPATIVMYPCPECTALEKDLDSVERAARENPASIARYLHDDRVAWGTMVWVETDTTIRGWESKPIKVVVAHALWSAWGPGESELTLRDLDIVTAMVHGEPRDEEALRRWDRFVAGWMR